MGSQTLEILRQGVWASLTGGWFYDPHQGVFCNVVHLYLWLFLLCSPFVAYLYFPSTWLTWCIYCILTSITILLVKLVNMALHRLYDRAQTMSEANLKNPFFKITKETESREDETGIEMKVLGNDDSRNSLEQVLNDARIEDEENSMMSMENVNSIIDLKVDVHRKNSSESIELMFYAPSLIFSNNSQDQQSIAGSTSVTKSIRSTNNAAAAAFANNAISISAADTLTKYLTVYPEHESEISKANTSGLSAKNFTSSIARQTAAQAAAAAAVASASGAPHLLRKSSEESKRRHQRRRLERQSSLDATAESAILSKLIRNQSDIITGIGGGAARNETFLHSQQQNFGFANAINTTTAATTGTGAAAAPFGKSASGTKMNSISIATTSTTTTSSSSLYATMNSATQRLSNNSNNITSPNATAAAPSTLTAVSTCNAKNSRLQRHRSSETHDERIKQQQRGIFLPIHHEHRNPHNVASGASSSGALAAIGGGSSGGGGSGILDADDMELGLGGSASGVDNRSARALQPWILGSSSDVYIEDDSFTKSDFGIEQIEYKSKTAFLIQQQYQLNSHHHPQQFRSPHNPHNHHHQHHHGVANIRKDSNSTMSALQLPITAPPLTSSSVKSSGGGSGSGGGMKRRRHSNATSLFKSGGGGTAAATTAALASGQQTTVRRIKSTALEISCPRPSVSNLSPHPNSVEAINGQQQIKNPQSALFPPPSKCLVRNPHLNLCPKFGGSFGGSIGSGGSGGSLSFGASASGSTTALIEPGYPIVEQVEKKPQRNLLFITQRHGIEVFRRNRGDLEIADIDDDDEDEDIMNDIIDDGDNNIGNDDAEKHVDANDLTVDVRPRRHNALAYKRRRNRNHRCTESDVGDILADDDTFKDFDNIEHSLQQTYKQLDDLEAAYAEKHKKPDTVVYAEDSDDATGGAGGGGGCADEVEDDPSTTTQAALRQRLHSTDSETDNNGSRSPLLSAKLWECSSGDGKAADKAMRTEIAAVQQKHKNVSNAFPQHLRGEGDSGCPSSDCEQISASSKDMLLSGMDVPTNDTTTNSSVVFKYVQSNKRQDTDEADSITKAKNVEEGIDTTRKQEHSANTASSSHKGKSLGAIPKVVKYREMDETSGSGGSQLHKRRGGNSAGRSITTTNSQTKGTSGTSSSTSSRSISADSFSADIHKMLWVRHGGEVDELGRRIGADGAPISANTTVVPPNMSSAHFQFYQDAIQALSGYPDNNNGEGLSLEDRIDFRDKLRRISKQISEPGNFSIGDFSHAHDLHTQHSTTTSQGRTSAQPPIGAVVPSPAFNARNVNNAATLSIQGLINVINDERNSLSHHTRSGNSASGVGGGYINHHGGTGNAAAAAILNVEGHHHMDSICDYWRPAGTCLLPSERPFVPKSFYKYRFKCFGYEHEFKISMDRLELLALFDRDLHWFHILLSVTLCTTVAYLGATILQQGYYKDLFAFLFCAVIAGSQYSLVKSVQPDAASPIHGFNKTVAYSRAIYFSLCGGLLLLLEQMRRDYVQEPPRDLIFFGLHYSPAVLTAVILHIMYVVLLCFPLIFSLGLFPQINTFLMYLLEQIDMHVFGGNAAGSLLGSFLCVLRSILGVMLLYGPLYAALAEGRGTQFIVFSIFCAMLIPLGYHLSRSASDFSHIWALIKNCIVSTYRDDDDELSAASSSASRDQKMATSTPKQLKQNSRRRSSSADKTTRAHGCSHGNTVSNENIEMTSLEKLPTAASSDAQHCEDHEHMTNLERKSSKSKASSLGSSSQTLGKTVSSSKKAMTASNSYASMVAAAGGAEGCCGDAGVNVSTENEFNICRTNETTTTNEHNEIVITTDTSVTNVNGGISISMGDNDNNEAAAVAADNDHVADEHANNDKVSNSSTTNPGDMSTLTAGGGINCLSDNETESPDPLPKKLQNTVNTRLKNDIVVTALLAVIVLGLHCSTVFTALQPDLNIVLYAFTITLGFLLHYIIPQMRKHMPWLCFSRPILLQKEFGQYEVSNASKVMWFEKVYIYLCMVERNVLFPLLVISALTADSQIIANKFGIAWGTLIVAVCALKFIRSSYSDPANQYLIVMFTVFFFRIDFTAASETFLIDYFFVSLAFRKCCDFLLKLQFIVTYIAPWQITWGSAFHAFAQPFSVPHSAMLFLQAAVSAILSTPLNPFLGSAIFLTSYVRPIKFWERDYNTRRIDHSNTRLSSQLERDLGADDNNLNSIFYEHLTRSLQHSLCGDLLMGRWGNVNQGDCFVLASDYLNCLVHIIELGNGLCTFQMRGLEFRGTYCQQREVEAITEDVDDNDGCCCCDPGHLPRLLSINAMFSTRWLAWQVVAAQYVLEGYSISDNLASASLQVFEYRKVLITYYIKSIIYFVIKNPKLEQWLASGPIQDALQHTLSRQFVDLDPIFNYNLDDDFDFRAVGITRSSFCYVYLSWINFCCDKRKESQNPPTNATPQTPAAAYNDSKSTPNLSTSSNAQTKSQSQQQLRTRPQKSATMSGSATVNSNEHIAISQSFANISRQTSESAPGLSGAGLSHAFTSSAAHGGVPLNDSLNNSAATVGASVTAKLPLGQLRASRAPAKPLRKEDSPTATVGRAASEEANRDRPTAKVKVPSIAKDSPIVSLCLALGLLARRSLATASSHNSLTGVEFFLHGLHALFKGDFRITSPRDEWVFADMELLHSVVAPAVKMALKLQQDHISNPDEFLDPSALYEAIETCSKDLVISHEADPVWRSAVLRGAPNLLALRHVMEDGSDEYRIIRLAKRFLSFRVIKLNRECVRGLWAGQQQELIYLRNRNPERGSIQNAKQALRNIINSSCDQPIGYPIYVSPLTTSYADTNDQLRDVIGGAITLESIKSNVLDWWHRIRERCRQGCSSGSALETSNIGGISTVGPGCSVGGDSGEIAPVYISAPLYNTLTVGNFFGLRSTNVSSIGGSLSAQYGSDGISAMRSSLAVMPVKPTSTTLLAGLLNREREQERERDMLRDSRGIRKSQTQSVAGARAERERRATLPVASTSLGVVSDGAAAGGISKNNGEIFLKMGEKELQPYDLQPNASSSPRYAKISCSSGSLGIGNIITTPGDYPRKSKGPVCLTAAAAGVANDATKSTELMSMAHLRPRIELYKKVIIVDYNEIYDCLDLGRRIDVIWPSEQMRSNGGRLSWKNWIPHVGMVGYVVHYWIPNHADQRFRSHVNRIIYLVEIGEHFVPVGEYGLREYNQIVDSMEEVETIDTNLCSRRSSMQLELDELHHQHREGLTPILGSSLESPTSQLASTSVGGAFDSAAEDDRHAMQLNISSGAKTQIKAVSSSSSEDEIGLMNLEIQRSVLLLNMWKLLADQKSNANEEQRSENDADGNVDIDDDGEGGGDEGGGDDNDSHEHSAEVEEEIYDDAIEDNNIKIREANDDEEMKAIEDKQDTVGDTIITTPEQVAAEEEIVKSIVAETVAHTPVILTLATAATLDIVSIGIDDNQVQTTSASMEPNAVVVVEDVDNDDDNDIEEVQTPILLNENNKETPNTNDNNTKESDASEV